VVKCDDKGYSINVLDNECITHWSFTEWLGQNGEGVYSIHQL
jgi:hypothetical protein